MMETTSRREPSLLDRLTDDQPEQRQESREKRVLSPSRLRECVRRDLSWLLNTTQLGALQDLEAHPEVARSVLYLASAQSSFTTGSTLVVDGGLSA